MQSDSCLEIKCMEWNVLDSREFMFFFPFPFSLTRPHFALITANI